MLGSHWYPAEECKFTLRCIYATEVKVDCNAYTVSLCRLQCLGEGMRMKQFHVYSTNATRKYAAHPLKERQRGIRKGDGNTSVYRNVTSCSLVHKEKMNNAK